MELVESEGEEIHLLFQCLMVLVNSYTSIATDLCWAAFGRSRLMLSCFALVSVFLISFITALRLAFLHVFWVDTEQRRL